MKTQSYMTGWIRLHRQLLSWQWYDDANVFRLFIHLLLNANHEDMEWRGIKIKRGQRFTSVKHLSDELKLSDKAIRVALSKLKKTKEIEVNGASNGTMITICKYETYQITEEAEGQAEGQTRGKRRATNKNDKNNININTLTWRDDFKIYLNECNRAYNEFYNDSDFINHQSKLNPNVNVKLSIQKGYDNFWGTEAGWKHKKKSKTEEINWRLTIVNSIGLNKVYFTKKELAEIESK